MKKFSDFIVGLSAIGLLLISLFSFLGERYYASELLSHFRIQYIGLFLIIAVYFALLNKKWLWPGIAAVGLFINVATILPIYLPRVEPETTSDAKKIPNTLSVVFANIYPANRNRKISLDVITSKKSDVVILDEVNGSQTNVFQQFESNYPYHETILISENFGMAIYSKYRLHDVKFEQFVNRRTPGISASITLNDRRLRIIAVHPDPPVSPFRASQQRRYFKNLIETVTSEDDPVIVVGDFNSSMWSPRYRKLIRETGLINARQGKGIYPTWSPLWPSAPFLSIPIDHILISPELDAVNFETLSYTGSEHLPIYAEVNYQASHGADRLRRRQDDTR